MVEKETEFQRLGRNKSTQINKTYINSGEYRKKFELLSDSKELNRLIYKLAKKMLKHRTGTEFEDMYWVDLDTLMVVAKELNAKTAATKYVAVDGNRDVQVISDEIISTLKK